MSAAQPRIDGRTLSHATAAAIRRLAVQRVERGERPSAVMRSFGYCRTSIYRWLRSYRAAGWSGIARRRHPGRRANVAPETGDLVRAAIVGKRPSDHGLRGDLWTRSAVVSLLDRRWGVRLSVMGAGRLLARLDLRAPEPLPRTPEEIAAVRPGDGRPLSLRWVAAGSGRDGGSLALLLDGRGRFLAVPVPARASRQKLLRVLLDSVPETERPVEIRAPRAREEV